MKPWSLGRGHWWAVRSGGIRHWAWTFPKPWLESKAKATPHGQEREEHAYGKATTCRTLPWARPTKVQMKMLLSLAGKAMKIPSAEGRFCNRNAPSAKILCKQGRTVRTGDFASFSVWVGCPSSDLGTVFSLLNSKTKHTARLGSSLPSAKWSSLKGRSDLCWWWSIAGAKQKGRWSETAWCNTTGHQAEPSSRVLWCLRGDLVEHLGQQGMKQRVIVIPEQSTRPWQGQSGTKTEGTQTHQLQRAAFGIAFLQRNSVLEDS